MKRFTARSAAAVAATGARRCSRGPPAFQIGGHSDINLFPVLGIAAQIPSAEIGAGYFQETHPSQPHVLNLLADCPRRGNMNDPCDVIYSEPLG